jgi:excisionase family DNA binding protein
VDAKRLLTIKEASDRLGLSRSTVYPLVMTGQVQSVKIGRARRIPVSAIDEFVERKVRDADPFVTITRPDPRVDPTGARGRRLG